MTTTSYVPSEAIRALILARLRQLYPLEEMTPENLAFVDHQIAGSVRGFISTLGLGLDADLGETYAMTEGGVLKAEVVKCYLFRLPVLPQDEEQLALEVARDLYRYAGQPIMEMASARLEVREGELVVIGLESRKKREPSTRKRATVFVPD
jgi:hypothetical protein